MGSQVPRLVTCDVREPGEGPGEEVSASFPNRALVHVSKEIVLSLERGAKKEPLRAGAARMGASRCILLVTGKGR